jgi:hypothetical protein
MENRPTSRKRMVSNLSLFTVPVCVVWCQDDRSSPFREICGVRIPTNVWLVWTWLSCVYCLLPIYLLGGDHWVVIWHTTVYLSFVWSTARRSTFCVRRLCIRYPKLPGGRSRLPRVLIIIDTEQWSTYLVL